MSLRTEDPDYIPTRRYRVRVSFTCPEGFWDYLRYLSKKNGAKNISRFIEETLRDALPTMENDAGYTPKETDHDDRTDEN